MRTFVESVAATIERRRMLKGGERVLVAVSGGPDSLALLHALLALTKAYSLDLHVAHFDHRMRPGSGEDAVFVSDAARGLGLACTTGSADVTVIPGTSPEEAARERRLRFLEDTASAIGAQRIATGHTLDDQAETVLMRVLTGAGIRGIAGIPPVRDPYIRPLIDRRRDEVQAYCATLGLQPRFDPTNADPAFARNMIRNEVMPFLAERVNVRVTEALARAAETAREDDTLLDDLAREAAVAEPMHDRLRLDVATLLAIPLSLRRRAVRLALPDPLSLQQIEAILELAATGASGAAIDLAGGLNARLEYGSLLIGRASSPAPPPRPVRLDIPGRTELEAWSASMTAWVTTERPTIWPDGKMTTVMDADRIDGAFVRAPKTGDRMTPLGLAGSKTIAAVLSDAKVPRTQRERIPIVARDSEVMWIVGHGLSDAVKVRAQTKRFAWFSFEEGQAWGK